MRPLCDLSSSDVAGKDLLVFDLDDTLLDHGALTLPAYAALFDLRAAGVELVACTGRPSGWSELLLRQWPLVAAVAENGALVWERGPLGRASLVDTVPSAERQRRRRVLQSFAIELGRRFDVLRPADDNNARVTDITFDIGEHEQLEPALVNEIRQHCQTAGIHTFTSSIHLHITLEQTDKARGLLAWRAARGESQEQTLARVAYVGDSANDAAAFATFTPTFGVANVSAHLARLPVPPQFVATREMGAGFAEIAARICLLRTGRDDTR